MFVLKKKQIDSGIFDLLFTKMKKKKKNLDLHMLINVQN